MTKARTLADFISDGSPLADGTISVSEVSGAAPLANPTFTGTVGATTITSTGGLTLNTTDANGTGIALGLDGDKKVRFYDDQGATTKMYWNASTVTQKFEDNSKLVFGSSEDLQIYHNGLHSYIQDTGQGNLTITAQNFYLNNGADTENMISAINDGAVTLMHDGNAKIATSSTGVDITGEVKADKFTNDEALPTVRPSLLLDFANSKTLDPRITFTRGSTATYWDGKTTTKAEENLLSYSQEFSNSFWANKGNTYSVTENATAPDGTTTASTWVANSTVQTETWIGFNNSNVVKSGETYTFSVYAKPSGFNWIVMNIGGSGSHYTYFDIANGSVGTVVGPSVTTSITSVGNGWYRCAITRTHSGSTFYGLQIYMADGDGDSTTTGNNADGVLLWGAQLELGNRLTAYTPTTSSPIVKYQPTLQTAASGEARFDHDPVTGESKGLLIEEARTNLFTYSEQFDVAGGSNWTRLGNVQVRSNQAIAPDGTLTADELYLQGGGNQQNRLAFDGMVTTSAGTYTISAYMKSNGLRYVAMTLFDGSYQAEVGFDLVDGVASNKDLNTDSFSMTHVGNGWYYCVITGTVTGNIPTANYASGFWPRYTDGGAGAEPGDATQEANGVLIWGAQMEVGAFPTSYIPTSGSTVTRSADIATIATANILSTVEGTIYAESISGPTGWDAIAQYNIFHYGDDNANGYGVFKESGSKDFWYHLRKGNSSLSNVNNGTNWTPNLTSKVVIGFDNSTQAYYVDGNQIGGNQTVSLAQLTHTSITELNIGSSGSGAYFNGHIKKLSAYNKRLTNATLQAMTEE
ncbi:LamG domain-containing protein [Planktomarina temperata]|nr:LamG domain-containing protein [Planktomarina temperata]